MPAARPMIGYHLSSEEHGPRQLVAFARRAEAAAFDYLQISDHFHPWALTQGQSPFVWGVLGALAEATQRVPILTAVTCPTIRIHPAIVAHAAATAAVQLPGRFMLGVGSGERLNEAVLGDRWPASSVRLEMLGEAIEVMRELWSGRLVTHQGRHYRVENARLFTRPEAPPPVIFSAFGPDALDLALEIEADGLMSTKPDDELPRRYRDGGGRGDVWGMTHVCVAASADDALAIARRQWPNSAVPGLANLELSIPEHIEAIGAAMGDEAFRDAFVLGDEPDAHVEEIRGYLDAGYDHVAVHQVGEDQETFFDLYEREVLPSLGSPPAS